MDMLRIPYSCCPTAIGALTFNKYLCKHFLHSFGIKIAPSVRLQKGDPIRPIILAVEPGLPAFVKPNAGGSSVATTRVDEVNELLPAVELAFSEADEVLIEGLITGTEVTCCLLYTSSLSLRYRCGVWLCLEPRQAVDPRRDHRHRLSAWYFQAVWEADE